MFLTRSYPVVIGAGVGCGVIAAVKAVKVNGDSSDARSVYRVTVRMDDGSERILSRPTAPTFAVGARVRVNGHSLERG